MPQKVPYLTPDPVKVAEWRKIFPNEDRFRIGLVWQGAPTHRDDHNRSCPLSEFLMLRDLADVDFCSLQIGTGAEQIHGVSESMVIADPSGQIQDFADTAAIIANLDLVISVDTAVAHLAGALGKPVWTVLPYVPEWRWLLGRDDTSWYPTMRLFRQTTPGDWMDVFHRLRDDLELLLDSADLLNQFGIIQLKSGSAGRADRLFSRAIACESDNAEFYCNRGVALDTQRLYEAAISCYQEAVSHKPDFINALFNMGNSYLSLNKPEEARACYERVIELNPDFVAAHLSLGEVEKNLRNFAQARRAFERAESIDPDCADALQGIAEVCQAEERYADAIEYYQLALGLRPGNVVVLNMMGAACQSIEQLDEAEECYRQALALTPHKLSLLNNLGAVLNAQGRLPEAVAVYRNLLEIDPDYADGHWNLSVALLALGSYSEGWREFEWRFKKANPVPLRNFPQPFWDGSRLDGKTILLHAEQGFGDTIQFSRYAPLVAQRGGEVVFECQDPALKGLLKSLGGVAEVVVAGEPLPHFDCHLPLMSLPLVFGTTIETIPHCVPYLAAQPADISGWKNRMGATAAFRVGLVWFGRQSQVLNRKRSCSLATFARLAAVPGVEFYSLQVGDGAQQLKECKPGFSVIDLTQHIKSFADTAAFVANLDLVITIDTAVAHLAGALGVPTWTLLTFSADWRWLCERADSPWYPSMRLFRQPSQGDWASVLDDVAVALHACVNGTDGERIEMTVHSNLRVGLAWAGRQDNPLNCKRSCPFSVLEQLFDLRGITFVNLQMDTAEGFDVKMIDMTDQIRDFEDTAALMANLDLVISIDTSVAHLAAATGRPTWVILPHVADWRWAPGHKTSPWYPDVELFRQSDFGDWDGVISEVARRLSECSGGQLQALQATSTDLKSTVSTERFELEQLLEIKQREVLCDNTFPDALLNLGATLALLGRDNEAVDVYRHVLELDPEHIAGHLNLAYSLLATGKYSEGWEHFEWRLKRLPPDLLPPWPMLHKNSLGKHPAGASIMVHCEQGYGDTIQFSRFLPLLAEAGYRVVVSCQPAVASLIESIPGVYKVVPHGDPLPLCDLQVLLLSLPWLFSVTCKSLPVTIPYLEPKEEKVKSWKEKLEKNSAA